MKIKLSTILAVAAVCMVAVCCTPATSLEIDDVHTSGTIDSQSDESVAITMGPESGSVSVKISANKAWAVSFINGRADDWISVSPSQGEGSGSVSVSVKANDTYEERNATLKIESEELSKTIRITQKQNNAVLVSSDIVEVGAEGKIISLDIRHNIDYSVKIDDNCSSWITETSTKSMVSDRIAFSIAQNTSLDKRQGKIRISSSVGEETVTVYQAGETPSLVLTQSEYAISDKGGVIDIEVSSNVDVDYSISADWITEVVTKSMSTNKYSFKVGQNNDVEGREAEITFSNKANGLTEKVKIYQSQKDALVVAKDSYQLDNNGGTISIEVGHNVDFTFDISDDWITEVQTKAYSTETLTFSIAPNDSYDNRNGTISFVSTDNKITQTVKIYQTQTDALIVSEKEFNVSDKGETISFEIKSNIDYSITGPGVSWIHETETKALTSTTKVYVVDANETYDARSAEIVVTNKKTQASEKVIINQLQKDAIILTEKEFEFTAEGGSFKVVLRSNIDYELASDADWISESGTKALTEHTHIFAVAALPDGTIEREGHLTFKDINGSVSETVTVKQSNGIQLDRQSLNVILGDSEQLTATVNIQDKRVIWNSSDSNVATVDANGLVTGVSKGKATITASTYDKKHSRTCEVSVDDISAFVVARFAGGSIMQIGDIIWSGSVLNFALYNNTNKEIIAESLMLYDSVNGTIENSGSLGNTSILGGNNSAWSLKVGSGGIQAPIAIFTYKYNGKEYKAYCTMDSPISGVPLSAISLNKHSLSIEEGGSEQLSVSFIPDFTNNKDVTWSSSNPSVASVDADGLVTALKVGTATITATASDGGKTDTCIVTVTEKKYPVTGVSLDLTSLTLYTGENHTLVATVSPQNATNKAVIWSSDNDSVATVDENGNVKALAAGEATITVKTDDGSFTATCTVTVLCHVESVSLDKNEASISVGETIQLSATVSPSNAADPSVTWSSDNEKIATVENGLVKGISLGTATITVKTKDGNHTATCSITVTPVNANGNGSNMNPVEGGEF